MCLSPEVDLVAGIVVGGIGVDVLGRVRRPAELALASRLLLLGVQQLVEAVLWWRLDGSLDAELREPASWSYPQFDLVMVPVLVPLTFSLLAPDRRRRSLLRAVEPLGTGRPARCATSPRERL